MPGGTARRGIYWDTDASGNRLARLGLAPALRRTRGLPSRLKTGVFRAVSAGMPEIENQFRFVRGIRLSVEISQMSPDRRRRDAERRGDQRVLLAAAAEREHLALAPRQPATLCEKHDRVIRLRRKAGGRVVFLDGPVRASGILRARRADTAETGAIADYRTGCCHVSLLPCQFRNLQSAQPGGAGQSFDTPQLIR